MQGSPRLAGLTRTEWLVLAGLAALFLAYVAVALTSVRITPPIAICLRNQRNLVLSLHNYDTTHRKLPGWANDWKPEQAVDGRESRPVGWIVPLLPHLDSQLAAFPLPLEEQPPQERADGRQLVRPFWPHVPNCPLDVTDQSIPKTSYVANCGYPDPNWRATNLNLRGASARDAARWQEGFGSAVFHNNFTVWGQVQGQPRRYPQTVSTLNGISAADGTSCTLMIGENSDATYWHGGPENEPLNPTEVYESSVCFCWVDVPPEKYPASWRVNAQPGKFPGRAPRLSSLHPAAVVVGMCDGRALTISPDIDPRTLVLLQSPQGSAARQPWNPLQPPAVPVPSHYRRESLPQGFNVQDLR